MEEAPTTSTIAKTAAYEAFRRELEAIPGWEKLEELCIRHGRLHGYRSVGQWIARRPPKTGSGA